MAFLNIKEGRITPIFNEELKMDKSRMYVRGKTPEIMRQGMHIRIFVLYECGGGGEGNP